ncbi:NfeD family protein [Mycoplasma todarodis]|uniref:NfeD-like C-terminal domain-containing protein n=1 Tax=Mycoplasma todarodis TaxID=1937191 RepID=A0A4R0XM09_9MOLU|nr:NfeD family protein [Mycoplasma todarodis]TCG11554.1 hypothetical protein C4B25_01070 [Mycoplasma todarodis]
MTFYIIMFAVWAIVAIVSVIIEFNTVQQVGFASCIGALVALIVHSVKSDMYWPEFVAYGATWAVSWVVLFFVMLKFKHKIHDTEDGFLDFIGKEVVANKGNEDETYGEISFGDKIFRFKSHEKIKKGDVVIIESIKGVTMTVKKKGDK